MIETKAATSLLIGVSVASLGIICQISNMLSDYQTRPAIQFYHPSLPASPKIPLQNVETPQDIANRSIKCLAEDVYYEARGEPERGQIAAAYVVMNRVQNELGGDVCRTIWKSHQFSWTDNIHRPEINDMTAWQKAYSVASKVYRLRVNDPTNGADHYLNKAKVHTLPKWVKKGKNIVKIANHTFMQLMTH